MWLWPGDPRGAQISFDFLRPELAESLLLGLKSGIEPAEPFFFDTPEVNRAAVALAERYDMKPVFATARMYTREEPDTPLDRLFGVTSFELG